MLGETWVGTIPAAKLDAGACSDAGLRGTVQTWCLCGIAMGCRDWIQHTDSLPSHIPNSQSEHVLARNCWHATATLQSLQSSKMAGPSTGPGDMCGMVCYVDYGITHPHHTHYLPTKMVQLMQLVTSTSDAWSSTYTL